MEDELLTSQTRSGIVILEPGAFNLRFGFAEQEDHRPGSIVHCIAYKKNVSLKEDVEMKDNLKFEELGSEIDFEGSKIDLKRLESEIISIEKEYEGIKKDLQKANQNSAVHYLNQENCCEVMDGEKFEPTEWTNISENPSVVIGDKALYLDDNDGYNIYFPFDSGQFNYKYDHIREKGSTITHSMVLNSITQIWKYVVRQRLEISSQNCGLYDVLLIVPDTFEKSQIKDMIDILLKEIGFGNILLQKSSACSSLGAYKRRTCVVNLGFSHTNISCVNELSVIETSNVKISQAGLEISYLLEYLLKNWSQSNFFKYQEANLSKSIQDLIIFEEMKESICHLDIKQIVPKMYEFLVHHRTLPTKLYRIDVGLSQIFCPLLLFNHNLLVPHKFDDHGQSFLYDLEDPYSYELGKYNVKKTSKNSKITTLFEDRSKNQDKNNFENKNDNSGLNLEQAVAKSILSCPEKIQEQLFSQILLVGGTSQLPQLKETLEQKLQEMMANQFNSIHVITPPIGTSNLNCTWKGASILVKQTPRIYWLDKLSWKMYGMLALREKSSFSLD